MLAKHNISNRLVNKKGTTIRRIAKHEPGRCDSKLCQARSICHRTSVVYQETCMPCQQCYVGLTTRRLHDRAMEHLHAATHHSPSSAFGELYKEQHSDVGSPSLSFTILSASPTATSSDFKSRELWKFDRGNPRSTVAWSGFAPVSYLDCSHDAGKTVRDLTRRIYLYAHVHLHCTNI